MSSDKNKNNYSGFQMSVTFGVLYTKGNPPWHSLLTSVSHVFYARSLQNFVRSQSPPPPPRATDDERLATVESVLNPSETAGRGHLPHPFPRELLTLGHFRDGTKKGGGGAFESCTGVDLDSETSAKNHILRIKRRRIRRRKKRSYPQQHHLQVLSGA